MFRGGDTKGILNVSGNPIFLEIRSVESVYRNLYIICVISTRLRGLLASLTDSRVALVLRANRSHFIVL